MLFSSVNRRFARRAAFPTPDLEMSNEALRSAPAAVAPERATTAATATRLRSGETDERETVLIPSMDSV